MPNAVGSGDAPDFMWGFPKIGGTLFWGPYNKDPTIEGTILGSPIFGNSHFAFRVQGLGVGGPQNPFSVR